MKEHISITQGIPTEQNSDSPPYIEAASSSSIDDSTLHKIWCKQLQSRLQRFAQGSNVPDLQSKLNAAPVPTHFN